MKFIIDDEFRTLIPPLTDDEFARLEKSVLAEGVREPILTWNNTIVDGHNRYRICESHGLECPNRERDFASRDAAKLFIIANQLGRRNLTPGQKAALVIEQQEAEVREAARLRKLQAARANGGDRKSAEYRENHDGTQRAQRVNATEPDKPKGRTAEILAEKAGVGHMTIKRALKVKRENPELYEKVKNGEIAVTTAYQKVSEPIREGLEDEPAAKRSAASYTDDGMRICAFCGKPVYKQYQDKQNWCYNCGLKHATDMQQKYRDASRDLRENVPTYTIESLLAQLTASAESMRRAWEQTIEINESMGVKLKAADKKRLEKAMAYPSEMLERIKEGQK